MQEITKHSDTLRKYLVDNIAVFHDTLEYKAGDLDFLEDYLKDKENDINVAQKAIATKDLEIDALKKERDDQFLLVGRIRECMLPQGSSPHLSCIPYAIKL